MVGITKVTTASPFLSVRKGGEPGAGATGATSQKKNWPHCSVVGGGSIDILNSVFAGMRETVTVSDLPGVRKPSETTRALKKTIFTRFLAGAAEVPTVATPANATATTRAPSAIFPLPMDTR